MVASVLILMDPGSPVNIVEFLRLNAADTQSTILNDDLQDIATTAGQAIGIIHSPSTASIIVTLHTWTALLTHT